MTIGKLAKLANVTIETIRYYQRRDLLIKPKKPVTGYRQYPSEAIARIRFIKRAQQAGFTLNEISELLTLDNERCQDVQKLAEQKLQKIKQQIKDLITLRNVLEDLLKGCKQNKSTEHCSLINALSNPTDFKF